MNLNVDPTHIFEAICAAFLGGVVVWIKWVSKKIVAAVEEINALRYALTTLLPMKNELVSHFIEDARQFGILSQKVESLAREVNSVQSRCDTFHKDQK